MDFFLFFCKKIEKFIDTNYKKVYSDTHLLERYQSGRTGAVLKTVDLHGSGGSNPPRSDSTGGVVER